MSESAIGELISATGCDCDAEPDCDLTDHTCLAGRAEVELNSLRAVVAAARDVPALGLVVASCSGAVFRRDEAIAIVTRVQDALATLDGGDHR